MTGCQAEYSSQVAAQRGARAARRGGCRSRRAINEGFTAAALPLIHRDRWQSFATQAYPAAVQAANEAQRTHLEAEIKRQNVQTGPQ